MAYNTEPSMIRPSALPASSTSTSMIDKSYLASQLPVEFKNRMPGPHSPTQGLDSEIGLGKVPGN